VVQIFYISPLNDPGKVGEESRDERCPSSVEKWMRFSISNIFEMTEDSTFVAVRQSNKH
jgi:hypothetical protein